MEQQFTIDPKLLDELSKSIKTEKDLAALSKHLLKLTVERAMDAELDEHLGYPKHAIEGKNTGNSRNGYSSDETWRARSAVEEPLIGVR